MLGCLTLIATIIMAVAAGLGHFSFWWVLLPAFPAASLNIANGPGFAIVMRANEEGRLGVFPMMLATHLVSILAVAGVAFWITSLVN